MSQPTPQPVPNVQPQYMPPMAPYVMMPVAQRNGLGVFGFLVALVGLAVPTGIVSLLGLMISLVAVGRAPRAWASMGIVLGLLGSVAWLVIMLVALVAGLVAALGVAVIGIASFMLVQPETVEITSDMVNTTIAAKAYEDRQQRLPAHLDDLDLSLAVKTDPWGNPYVLIPGGTADPGFDLVSAGPDGEADTDDDIRLSTLDRYWEDAFDTYAVKMEAFGERLEALEEDRWTYAGSCGADDRYADRATLELAEESDRATADEVVPY